MVARAVGPVGLVYFEFVAGSRFATFLLRLFSFFPLPVIFFSPFFLSSLSSAISFSFMISYRLYRPPFPFFPFAFHLAFLSSILFPLLWERRCLREGVSFF